MNKILVTGGAGYIGSHTTLALLQTGADIVVLEPVQQFGRVSQACCTDFRLRARIC